MAGKPGRSGTNKGQDKPWREALWKAVCDLEGKDKKLALIARAVVNAAAAGDMQAAKEIGDRLDGKPRQEVEHSGDVGLPFVITAPEATESTPEWEKQHKPH
jgi:hypothetical protein